MIENNVKLGELSINVPPKPKGEASINVRFSYDINGILDVELTCIDTGEKKQKIIVNSEIELNDDELKIKLKELEKIKIHSRAFD